METANIYVIHGYDSSPKKNWFVWLKNMIHKNHENKNVYLLEMPNSNNPTLLEWNQYLNNVIQNIDKNTFIVAHSLGCIASLQFLQQREFESIGGIILVSGFYEQISGLEILDSFIQNTLNFDYLNHHINKKFVIAAKDDRIVNYKYTKKLSDKLCANFILFNEGNHFMDSDGFNEFPMVYSIIEMMTK